MTDVTDSLLLNSLYIENYRTFPQLTIEKLGRVNLIVGRNSVGKSCLLDAVRFYLERASPQFFYDLSTERGEFDDESQNISAVQNLFFGRPDPANGIEQKIVLGQTNPQTHLMIQFSWQEQVSPTITVKANGGTLFAYNLATLSNFKIAKWGNQHHFYVSTQGIDSQELSNLWDKVTLTPAEAEVIKALQFIEPKIIGMNITRNNRVIVKLSDQPAPVALRSLGDGLNRLLGIALALVNAKNSVLLIDEIENGLHYTTQYQLWRLIFELAVRLNVQLFVTTHNWDCIKAFQQAASEATSADGMLIRLHRNKKGSIVATSYDEEQLQIVTEEQIEVR